MKTTLWTIMLLCAINNISAQVIQPILIITSQNIENISSSLTSKR